MSTRLLTLVARPSATGSDRLGIIASRKLGGAVVRNRAKRRIREVFRRRAIDEAASGRPLDIVAIARRELVAVPLAALAADFHAALQRLRGVR